MLGPGDGSGRVGPSDWNGFRPPRVTHPPLGFGRGLGCTCPEGEVPEGRCALRPHGGRIGRRARAMRIFGPARVMASADVSSRMGRMQYPYTLPKPWPRSGPPPVSIARMHLRILDAVRRAVRITVLPLGLGICVQSGNVTCAHFLCPSRRWAAPGNIWERVTRPPTPLNVFPGSHITRVETIVSLVLSPPPKTSKTQLWTQALIPHQQRHELEVLAPLQGQVQPRQGLELT